MMKHTICGEIEFVGGPIDGHRQQMTLSKGYFVGVAMRSSLGLRGVFDRLLARLFQKGHPVRLAVYELDEHEGQYRYRHIGTQLVCSGALSAYAISIIIVPNSDRRTRREQPTQTSLSGV